MNQNPPTPDPEPVPSSSPEQPTTAAPVNRVIIKDTSKRDTWIAVGIGVVVMAIILFAIAYMGSNSFGVTGIIVEKVFIEQPETQITVGVDGLSSRDIAGDFRLIVRDPRTDRYFTVFNIPERTFNSVNVGDEYFLVRQRAREIARPDSVPE